MATLCKRIADTQYGMALDEARDAYRMEPGLDRRKRLKELRASRMLTERIAADLVRRWDAEKDARR